jgi:hypothetical protein
MMLASVPSTPRVRWWTKLARFPHRLWSLSGELTTTLTDHSHRQPSRRKFALIRIGIMASFLVVWPLAMVFKSRFQRTTGFDALDARVRETWPTSPSDAVALLRSTFEHLLAGDVLSRLRPLEVEPFGTFQAGDLLSVQRFLYDSEIALGHLEEALAVATAMPGNLDIFILQQVDCLVALRRQEEAIALLERNLDQDGWRGPLRRRLMELGGRHLRALN